MLLRGPVDLRREVLGVGKRVAPGLQASLVVAVERVPAAAAAALLHMGALRALRCAAVSLCA